MNQPVIILIIVAALGLAGRNSTVAVAAAVLLVLQFFLGDRSLHFFEEYALKAGIGMITLAVLIPFATGAVGYKSLLTSFRSPLGLTAFLVGVGIAYLGGKGVSLLTDQPQVMVGLLAGTIVGVAFFKGIPVGPLIGAGIVAVVLSKLKNS